MWFLLSAALLFFFFAPQPDAVSALFYGQGPKAAVLERYMWP